MSESHETTDPDLPPLAQGGAPPADGASDPAVPDAVSASAATPDTGPVPDEPMVFASLDALYRYPVKGLSPERLDVVELFPGTYFPGDRLYAIENGPSGFVPEAPAFQPKIKFLMLMRNERLAALETRYDAADATLAIHQDGKELVRGDLSTEEGRAAIEMFFQRYSRYELRGAPKVLAAPPGFRFVDTTEGFVSLLNLASCRALAELVGKPVDPLRFRANLHLDGMEAWEEFDLVGHTIEIGNHVRLRVTEPITRCAATNVDPTSAQRDLDIPGTLTRTFGHNHCGVFAEILEGGLIAEGDAVRLRL